MEFRNNYDFLSNMYSARIEYDGEVFPCVETAFQYMKCTNDDDRFRFMNNRGYWVGGITAKSIGRQVQLRKDWETVKVDIMLDLIRAKFLHNEKLRDALLATGTEELVEDNVWNDKFWGKCDGEGHNVLGVILMKVREEIRDFEEKKERKTMKVIVAGGRDFNNYKLLSDKLDYYFQNIKPVIVCGEAKGADSLGKQYAYEHCLEVMSFPADWSLGKGAGFIRNEQIASVADSLIAFWDGQSRGTKHMIDIMNKLGKPVKIVRYKL